MLNINLDKYSLTNSDIIQKNESTYLVTKWNWDYETALAFQEACQKEVHADKKLKILITCSHPHCFTMGRGLQKSQGRVIDGLVETTPAQLSNLPFPVFHIKRGGGLTFHYPGQWVFYPILNLNHPSFNLSDIVNSVLSTCIQVLDVEGIQTKSGELMGLWFKHKKFASVGVEINRFVTMHGTALSLVDDHKMFNALEAINPCGLTGNIYQSVESLMGLKMNLEDFNEKFLELFLVKILD